MQPAAEKAAKLQGFGSCYRERMRVLVVLSDAVDVDTIRQRCAAHVAQGHELAICFVLSAPTTLQATLETQRKLTAALRIVLGAAAETIAVFVVTAVAGDEVADCARAWGATDVET